MDEIEYRHVSIGQLETRLGDEEEGTFSGYANLHDIVDSYGTHFAAGAWNSGGLDGQRPYLWMHNPDEPVGVFTAREDERGLYIEGRYDDTVEGERARRRARSGSAPELSVGFIRRSVDAEDENRITSAELREVSQITLGFAAQPGAELIAARKVAEEMRKIEARQDVPPPQDEAQGVEITDDDLTEEGHALAEQLSDDRATVHVAAAERLHKYWVAGEGLAKWADKPRPWTALYHHLRKYIKDPYKAKATAAKWYREVKGHWPGEKHSAAEDVTKRADLLKRIQALRALAVQ